MILTNIKTKYSISRELFRNFISIEFSISLLLSGYVIYQFLATGLEILLAIPLVVAARRLGHSAISRNFLVSILLITLCSVPTFFTGGYLFAIKLVFYVFVANFVSRANLFNPKLFLISIAVHIPLYYLFFADNFNKFDNLSFFIFAPNYFVFLVVTPLLMLHVSPLIVAALSLISLSRWNFISIVFSYSRYFALMVLVAAFLNLIYGVADTTLGLKESSDGDRLNLLLFQIRTLDEYVFGKSIADIRSDIVDRVNFTTDTFEGVLFDAYSLFGIFGIFLLSYHFRLIGKVPRGIKNTAGIYIFLFSFFNPVIYSFSYFLFFEYVIHKNKKIHKPK